MKSAEIYRLVAPKSIEWRLNRLHRETLSVFVEMMIFPVKLAGVFASAALGKSNG